MVTHLDWSAYAGPSADAAFLDFSDPFSTMSAPAEHGDGWSRALAACVGDGQCRREAGSELMCPTFRATGDPLQSPLGRIEALRAAQAEDGRLRDSPALRASIDSCVGCKGCKRECPRGVDVAQMVAEARAQRVARDGLGRRAALFAEPGRWLKRMRPLARFAVAWRNRSTWMAWLGERALGVAASRRLPVPAARSFCSTAALQDDTTVLLWVDSFTRHFSPMTATAAIAVLEAAGERVAVLEAPPGEAPYCCGRTQYAAGQIDLARAQGQRLLDALEPALQRGLPLVVLEPACLSMLRDEFHSLGLGARVGPLARQACLVEEFLVAGPRAERLRARLGPHRGPQVLLHAHCHQKAYGTVSASAAALALVPGLEAQTLSGSCCGMAGSFGLESEHAALSRRMAEASLLPALRAAPDALVVSDGFSCRHQIEDLDGRSARHVVEVLEAALRA